MSDKLTASIVCVRAHRLPDGSVIQPGETLARVATKTPGAMELMRRLSWSAFRVEPTEETQAQLATSEQERLAAQQEAAVAAAASKAERAAAIEDLRQVDGIGAVNAARLVDHYHITSCHQLGAALSDERSCRKLAADTVLRASAESLANWRRQIMATQVTDDSDEDESPDTDEE